MSIRLFLSFFLFLNGCSNLKESVVPSDDVFINDFITGQRKKLPITLNSMTKWVDVYKLNNKLVYVYKVNMVGLDERVIQTIKNNNSSESKVNEICNLIVGTFDSKVDIEYKILNVNNLELVSMTYNEDDCN
ncbi:hypothetical protein P7L54_16560 [Acinetobacter bereziniae]|uniref:hypothetical protein n=1 Tax=Acinetobacter bereziniae TaxID=106648 RepID=UPI00190783DB|nr:hypothetical protein [Acinetobacter bereziniae]MDG3557557.1 hypothetical protein [Acinetobacter bereziniae]MDP6003616.1 hypothetical protein [Acinetobacter bereziniae]QQC81611.1 hypothetical protein I9192_05910 [Acinetobacter bereziniae]UUN94721.1 hypothetical protein I9189_005940 [Acinetobacter bereziniae]WMW75798.1 hypothetical protein RG306_05970 [Acinetobacter bereziniae]